MKTTLNDRIRKLLASESETSLTDLRRVCAESIYWHLKGHLTSALEDRMQHLMDAVMAGQHRAARALATALARDARIDRLPYCQVRDSGNGDEVTAYATADGRVEYMLDEATEDRDAQFERERDAAERQNEQAMDDAYSGYAADQHARDLWNQVCAQAGWH